jgi:hypothetical protein
MKNTNQSVMNNKNQSIMSMKNEQSLYEYLTQQMNDKISLLSELQKPSNVNVTKNPITGVWENKSESEVSQNELLIETTSFQIKWLSQQLLELNQSYGQYNETIKSLVMRDYLGNPKKYEVRSEGPSEGDIECIIEGLIEDKELEGEFEYLLERTLNIFNIK